VPGKGQIKTTGKLGEVMTESFRRLFSFVKARAPGYGIKPSIFNRKDIHIHLPEGAVPKDGPSAGIGMVTSDRLDPDRCAGAQGRRDDRRGHAAGARAADWRPQGKAARGAARRDQDRADPRRIRRIWPKSRQILPRISKSCRSAMSMKCYLRVISARRMRFFCLYPLTDAEIRAFMALPD
jgi:hypothetical protein